ncbi:MAG: tyrosine-type recombinase/integrase [Candidatus Humimicrobiaceae bacterium]
MKDKEIILVFDGPFKELCHQYISYKRSLGYGFSSSSIYELRYMDRFFKKYPFNAPRLTKEMVLSFTSYRENESLKTQHKRMSLIRQFAIFIGTLGCDAYIHPVELIKLSKFFTPYIFTHDEISRIIKASDNLKICAHSPNYHQIYPVLMRMLYGCGLRVSEALTLKVADVNLKDGILTVTKAKFNKSRLVPMSPSLTKVCNNYADKMRFDMQGDGYFFPAPDNGRYNRNPVYMRFRYFLKVAGIARCRHAKGLRLHDLRHSFAVHSLEKMVAEGQDIYCALPVLCTYLGHKGIESTEKYLRLTKESFSNIINATEPLYKGVFPEVNSNEK